MFLKTFWGRNREEEDEEDRGSEVVTFIVLSASVFP